MQNITKKIILTICVFALFTPWLFAQESEAQKAYNKGDYLEAAQLFNKQVKESKKPSAALYYNLGNSYYKLGLNSKALANYLRAWLINPRDKDIYHNLSFVLAQNGQTLIPAGVPESAFHLYFYLSIIELEGLLWLFAWLFTIVFIFVLFSNNKKLKGLLIFLGVILFLTSIWYFTRRPFDTKPLAVVNAAQAEVRSGPGENFPVNLSVPRSHIVEVKDSKEGWLHIYIPSEKAQGWVLKDSLEEI